MDIILFILHQSMQSPGLEGPGRPEKNLKPYNYRAVLIIIILIRPEVPFLQEVSGRPKTALQANKFLWLSNRSMRPIVIVET